MKLTKSKLKKLIKEMTREHFSSLNEAPGVDEEERREWADMIGRDISALQATLEDASDALGGLEPHHEQLLDTLSQLEEEPAPDEDYEESLRPSYDKEEAEARREGPSTPMTSEESAGLWDDDEGDW